MRKARLERSKTFQSGFTLVEVLVSIAIVAIVATGAYLAFGDSREGDLKNHAHKLLGQMNIAQEESIIRGVELGLRVDRDGYFFMIYTDGQWQLLEDHEVLRPQEFEELFGLHVQLEGQESLLKNDEDDASDSKDGDEDSNSEIDEKQAMNAKIPQIFMLSSGEMNKFVLTIGFEDSDEGKFYRIAGNYLGVMQIARQAIAGDFEFDWDKDFDEDWDKIE